MCRFSHCTPFCQKHKPEWQFGFHAMTDGISVSTMCTKPAGSSARPDTHTDTMPSDYVAPLAAQCQSRDILDAPCVVDYTLAGKSLFTAAVHSNSALTMLSSTNCVQYATSGCSAQQWHEDSSSHRKHVVMQYFMLRFY